jgi:glycosyltransferase involved in cell wall biosynthesis
MTAEANYDVAISYYLRPAEAVVDLSVPLRVAALQLSLALQWRRAASVATNPLGRYLNSVEAERLARYESACFRSFDRCLLISPHDAKAIAGVDDERLFFNPHGVDHRAFDPPADDAGRQGIVFSGLMSFQPNEDAALHFIEDIFPHVRAEIPNVTLTVVGKNPTKRLRQFNGKDGVVVTGTVPEIAPYLRSARVAVDPLRVGAGLQNKVLQALSCGTPVVMSTVANEGIGAPRSCCTVEDESARFAEGVVALLRDDGLWREKSRAARDFIQAEWTWEHHFEVLARNLADSLVR